MCLHKPNPDFFTKDWTISLPSHPHLRFTRLHPSNHSAWLDIASHPENNQAPGWPCQDIIWTPERRERSTTRFVSQFQRFQEKHNGLDVLVLDTETGRFLGAGQCHEVRPAVGNLGLELMSEARGRGVGKVLLEVLLRLSNELEVEGLWVQAGTMKRNEAMRRLARKMGWEETEEVVEVPERGVVAEVCWMGIRREEWLGLEWRVEWRELDDVGIEICM